MRNGKTTGQEVKIERGIPMPGRKYAIDRYPWEKLEVGESFLLPADVKPQSRYNIISSNSRRHAPKRFKSAITDQGVRVWRVE